MTFISWIAPSLVRHFPSTPARRSRPLVIEAALNEQFSFQVAMRSEGANPSRIALQARAPAAWTVRVRRVGYVSVLHHNTPIEGDVTDLDGLGHIPGYVPDPLFDEESLLLPDRETHAFWITVRPSKKVTPPG